MTRRQSAAYQLSKPQQSGAVVNSSPSISGYRIAVICYDILLAGGLLRFDRAGCVLRATGHEMIFVTLNKKVKYYRQPDLEVLSLDKALRQKWDAVMLPGAGFPDSSLALLPLFNRKNFGARIQHVLNDQSLRNRFKTANELFKPHVVVFNNLHWPPGSYSDLKADHFAVLLGGVDSQKFQPEKRTHPLEDGRWIIGGFKNKNPEVLIAAIRKLPENFALRLFGHQWDNLLAVENRDLIASKRLQLTGALHGEEMMSFYQGVDCVAMTEKAAGWSNMVAEAMASGVPVVCTQHGTTAFAIHEETALLFDPDDSSQLAQNIKRLATDKSLCLAMTERARSKIEPYSWKNYARGLLDLIDLKAQEIVDL